MSPALLVGKVSVFSILGVIGIRNQILCPDFKELFAILDDDEAVGHVVGEDLTAVSAGREDPSVLSVDGDDGVEVPFAFGDGASEGDLLGTGPMDGIDIHAEVDPSAFAAQGRADGVIVSFAVIVLLDDFPCLLDQLEVFLVQFLHAFLLSRISSMNPCLAFV